MSSPDYVARVNRAIDHVVGDLARPLRLEEVAEVAGFSPFHFHRVFQALVGETLHRFVQRVRLERALFLMTHDPERPLTDVALDCGFSSSSAFSRAFRQRFGAPPSRFDLEELRAERRAEFSAWNEAVGLHLPRLEPGENPDGFEVEILRLPARTIAYRRVPDPFRDTRVVDAAAELVRWVEARGLPEHRWLGYMWDDPDLVALADCRYDVGVVTDAFEPADGVGRLELPPMTVAALTLRGDLALEQRALDWIFGTWLPRSDWLPAEQPCFEAWHGRPFAHGTEHFELDLHLPVTRDRAGGPPVP